MKANKNKRHYQQHLYWLDVKHARHSYDDLAYLNSATLFKYQHKRIKISATYAIQYSIDILKRMQQRIVGVLPGLGTGTHIHTLSLTPYKIYITWSVFNTLKIYSTI